MYKPSEIIDGNYPPSWQPYITRLRRYLNDTAEQNELHLIEESSDYELFIALQDALDDINYSYQPETVYKISDFPSWGLLRDQALIHVLTMKGLHSARNTLSFNDAGGINVQDEDVYGRYINYYNVMIAKVDRKIMEFKRSKNIDNCYGGVHSEYLDYPE